MVGVVLKRISPGVLSNYVNSRIVRRLAAVDNSEWGEKIDYRSFPKARDERMKKLLKSPTRFQSIKTREDRSDMPLEAIKAHMKGKYFIQHRNCQMLKTADDMSIIKELLSHVRPATIIEIGTFTGGSAVWMADMLKLEDIRCEIYSMDIDPSLIEDSVQKIKPNNVQFIQGNSKKIQDTFPNESIIPLPRPLIVFEDSHVNTLGVLEHFMKHMRTGDYFVVEDTSPILPQSQIGYPNFQPEHKVPSSAGNFLLHSVKEFLAKYDGKVAVDSFFTDFYGYNGTWNWHGFIRRM